MTGRLIVLPDRIIDEAGLRRGELLSDVRSLSVEALYNGQDLQK